MPLRFGAGVKGKLLESMYYGVPVISTKVGMEGIADVEKNIVVADKSDDFANRIIDLYGDKNKWEEFSKRVRRFIETNFSLNVAKKIILKDVNLK